MNIKLEDLTKDISSEAQCTQKNAKELLKILTGMVEDGLKEEGVARIPGLGIFRLRWVEAREGRNPQTGETIQIPGHSRVIFKAEKTLREYVNRRYAHLKPKILNNKQKVSKDSTEKKQHSNKNRYLLVAGFIIILLLLLIKFNWHTKDRVLSKESQIASTQEVVTEVPKEAITAPVEQESVPVEIEKPTQPLSGKTFSVKVKPGDNLWTLSRKHYKNSFAWPVIYRDNLGQIMDPDQIMPGDILNFPDLQGSGLALTMADSHMISLGYKETCDYYQTTKPALAALYMKSAKMYETKNP